uniref:FK506-binding protein n=1 Tax=Araucaria cunninghamii TaxID=56994 RepID=A0A0D6R2F7_ARACU
MAFWGAEVKSGKPIILHQDLEKGRLHLTRATLGLDASPAKKCVVQCNIGGRPPVILCSFLPGKKETCSLNLEFDEEEEIKISVSGAPSVHLTGYYDQLPGQDEYASGDDEDYDSEQGFSDNSYGDEEEDFIFDDDEDDDVVPNSGVKIEEIEEEPPKENTDDLIKKIKGKKKDKKKVKEEEEQDRAITAVNGASKNEDKEGSESEDEDGFPIPGKRKKQDNENVSETEPPPKKQSIEGNSGVAVETVSDATQESKLSKKKKKKAKNKDKGDAPATKEGTTGTPSNVEKMAQEVEERKGNNVRTFPNGLVIEEVAMGKPDGKKASPGNKVSVFYTGKLQKNGKIFDSNVGRKPFQFRLGVGEVISGWDVGVKGMRVGDKRRLTIPPSMGYGAKGAGPSIPGNAWLVFDVELVGVK